MKEFVDSGIVNMKRGSDSWDIPLEAPAVRNIPELLITEYGYVCVAVRCQWHREYE